MTELLSNYIEKGYIVSAKEVVNDLLFIKHAELMDYINKIDSISITKQSIPQYSDYSVGTYELIRYLRMSGDYGPSYLEVGEHFLNNSHKTAAYIKYGENHSKLAELLGLVKIIKCDKKRVFLSEIGKEIEKLEPVKQYYCFTKLAVRIPIVQEAIRLEILSSKELENLLTLYLSPITAIRRRKNTWFLIELLRRSD